MPLHSSGVAPAYVRAKTPLLGIHRTSRATA